jgi:hypothetical protein
MADIDWPTVRQNFDYVLLASLAKSVPAGLRLLAADGNFSLYIVGR